MRSEYITARVRISTPPNNEILIVTKIRTDKCLYLFLHVLKQLTQVLLELLPCTQNLIVESTVNKLRDGYNFPSLFAAIVYVLLYPRGNEFHISFSLNFSYACGQEICISRIYGITFAVI